MGLFSVRGRLPQPAERPSPVRIHWEVLRRLGAFRARLAHAARVGMRNTGHEAAARLGKVRLAAIAATNDALIVAILLVVAAVALGLEMAASFHVI